MANAHFLRASPAMLPNSPRCKTKHQGALETLPVPERRPGPFKVDKQVTDRAQRRIYTLLIFQQLFFPPHASL